MNVHLHRFPVIDTLSKCGLGFRPMNYIAERRLEEKERRRAEIIDAAEAAGSVLAPFQNRRWDGDFLTVKKLLAEGTLGRVVQVISRFDRFRPLQRPGTWKETGGQQNGVLFDLGPHLIDQALALFGPPDRISASDREERDRTDIDDAFQVVLEYDNINGHPLRYTCEATLLAADPSPRFQVHGTLGSYTKRGVDPQEPAVLKGARPPHMDSAEPWLPEPESAWGTLTVATKTTEPIELDRAPLRTETGDYRNFYANVRDAIVQGKPLAVTGEDAFRTLRLLELAVQAAAERRTLPVTF